MQQKRAVTGFEGFELLWQSGAVVHLICVRSCSSERFRAPSHTAPPAASPQVLLPLQNFHSTTSVSRIGFVLQSDLEMYTVVGRGRMKARQDGDLRDVSRQRHMPGLWLEGHPMPAASGAASFAHQGHRGAQRGNRDTPRVTAPALGAVSTALCCMAEISGGILSPAGKPLHSTNPLMPQDFRLISLTYTAALGCPAEGSGTGAVM